MNDQFGKFIREKREEKKMNLRKLATILDIAPAYMSDIEKAHRYPPDIDRLNKIAEALEFSKEDSEKMFDLAALAKENSVSPDLPDYIMKHEKLRAALRTARDNNKGEDDWQKIIDMLESNDSSD